MSDLANSDVPLPKFVTEFVRCRPWIEAALNSSSVKTHNADDVLVLIARGEAQLWADEDGCIVTMIETHPRAKVVSGWLAGGSLQTVERLVAAAEEWAAAYGCDFAYIHGRLGWQKSFFKQRGYNVDRVSMSKDLRHATH